ncbi:DUF2975 domain-containing protein [Fusibacter sp. JL298sf-3]
MKNYRTLFLRGVIYIMGAAALWLAFGYMPGFASKVAETNPEFAFLKFPVLIFVYATLVPFLWVLFSGHQLLGLIDKKQAFSRQALTHLRAIEYAAFFVSAWYVFGAVLMFVQNALHPAVLIIGVSVVFAALCVGFFADVLHSILKTALALQEESDLTI